MGDTQGQVDAEVLAPLVDKVHTIEIIPELGESARKRLERLGNEAAVAQRPEVDPQLARRPQAPDPCRVERLDLQAGVARALGAVQEHDLGRRRNG